MDISFRCSNCGQELAMDESGAGAQIQCPTCNTALIVPKVTSGGAPSASQKVIPPPPPPTAPAHEEKHFSVPVHEGPTEMLVEHKRDELLEPKKSGPKQVKVRCIKRTDCVEVGKDLFDHVVSEFLGKVGEENIINISPLNYTHVDMGSRQILTDYGVMIVYKG